MPMKKVSTTPQKKPVVTTEFRPYRVLFLVVVVGITCLVLFAALGVMTEATT